MYLECIFNENCEVSYLMALSLFASIFLYYNLMMTQTWGRNWMPDNKYSPKGELCEVENIGYINLIFSILKVTSLELLKILSAN